MMTSRQRFLAALRRERVDRPALGTVTSLACVEAMDACGAAFPEAHQDPKLMARLASYVSLEAGFDMIFPVYSVVHEAAALGAAIDWGQRDRMPSVKAALWQDPDDIAIPADFEARPAMRVVLDALRALKKRYGRDTAIVGKTFGPWSLGYHLFGVDNILVMTLDDPDRLQKILGRLLEITMRSARAQIEAGADALCLGDHCSRDMCSPEAYRRFLLPLHQRLAKEVPGPLVLHTCGETADRIPLFAETGLAAFHYDTRVPAATAKRLAGGKLALMGGVNNVQSLRSGDTARIEQDVREAVAAGIHVIGPECAIPLDTPLRGLKAIRPALEKALTS
ncbi:MAG: MtaA/CmuA family methyltransferase [Lentisphaerae bacterium]|nr:MtaA/CmuA family methyltransferase [Lentisphaerota bacterium]